MSSNPPAHRGQVLFASAAALLIATVMAAPVAADGPTREPAPSPPSTDTGCGFPITIETLVNRENIKTFTDASGVPVRQIVTGTLKVITTNPANSKSVTLNISGPAHLTLNPDGTVTLVYLGRSTVVGIPGESELLHTGRVVQQLPAGTIVDAAGRSVDLCALLA